MTLNARASFYPPHPSSEQVQVQEQEGQGDSGLPHTHTPALTRTSLLQINEMHGVVSAVHRMHAHTLLEVN